ncbi:MAG: hypothetical protein R3B71_00050 [Candidatus Gracilibacteria bacterium]
MGETEKHNPNQERPPHNETAIEKAERLQREAEEVGKKKIISKSKRERLKQQIENVDIREDHHYELGEYDGAKLEKKFNVVEGSVDATPYGARAITEKVYKDKSEAAALLVKIYEKEQGKDRFTSATQKLIEQHLDMLKKLGSQKKSVFEKGKTSEQLFSSGGIYNFVLAFQRAMDAFPSTEALEKSECIFHLSIGETVTNKDERYVRTFSRKEKKPEPGEKPDKPEVQPGKKAETPDEDYPDVKIVNGDYMIAHTVSSNILPTTNKFGETINIDLDKESTNVIDSYARLGIIAMVEGLNRLPEQARGPVLERVFQSIGEKDPEKGFQLMQEIIKNQKATQEEQLLEGLKNKIENSPENEKKYWQAQLALYEMGQLDENGYPKLEAYESQQKMREALSLLADINVDSLPESLQEMAKEQKKYLELSMRHSIATDMIASMNVSIDMMMKEMEDFVELKAERRADIKDDLDNMWDSDEEVYMAAKHVMEGLRLLIRYQYPIDAETQDITNPVKYYYDKLMKGEITSIDIPEGQTAVMTDVLKDHPTTIKGPGKIDLNELFVDRQEEARLFEEYQSGKERLGEKGIWALAKDTRDSVYDTIVPESIREYSNWIIGGVAGASMPWMIPSVIAGGALPEYFGGERSSFMEKQSKGGILQRSSEIFPENGDLAAFLNENPGGNAKDVENLGAVEKMQIEKIRHMFISGQFYEARALCIQILQKRLDEKKKFRMEKVDTTTPEFRELIEDHGEQIKAQAKLQLLEQGIDESNFAEQNIPKPGGGSYANLDEFIEEKMMDALKGRAYIDEQGVNASHFTDEEVSNFSGYEKKALELLNDLNGEGAFDLTEENAIIAKEITQLVVEIAIIELATWGAGTYAAAALAAARLGQMGVRAMEVANMVARASEYAAKVPRIASAGKTIAHATLFVQAQATMHGNAGILGTAEGWRQVGYTAATFGMMKGVQGLARGTAEGMVRTVEEGATGFQRLRHPLQQLQYLNRTARASGKLGTAGAEVAEGFVEIGALQGMSQLEQKMAIIYNQWTGDKKGELAARARDTKFWDWKELAHTAAVVISLRGGRLGGEMIGGTKHTPTITIGNKQFLAGEKIIFKQGNKIKSGIAVGVKEIPMEAGKILRLEIKTPDGKVVETSYGDIITESTGLPGEPNKMITIDKMHFFPGERVNFKEGNSVKSGKVLGLAEIPIEGGKIIRLKVKMPNGEIMTTSSADVVAPPKEGPGKIRQYLSERADRLGQKISSAKETIGEKSKSAKQRVVEQYGKLKEIVQKRSFLKNVKEELKISEKAQKGAEKELQELKDAIQNEQKIDVAKQVESIRQKAEDAKMSADAAKVMSDLALAKGVAEFKGVELTEAFQPSMSDAKAALKAEKAGELKGVHMKETSDRYKQARKAAEKAEKAAQEAEQIGLRSVVSEVGDAALKKADRVGKIRTEIEEAIKEKDLETAKSKLEEMKEIHDQVKEDTLDVMYAADQVPTSDAFKKIKKQVVNARAQATLDVEAAEKAINGNQPSRLRIATD